LSGGWLSGGWLSGGWPIPVVQQGKPCEDYHRKNQLPYFRKNPNEYLSSEKPNYRVLGHCLFFVSEFARH